MVFRREVKRSRHSHQYPLDEHVVVLLGELRPAQHEAPQQLHGRLAHAGGVVHETTVHPALHVRLQGEAEHTHMVKRHVAHTYASAWESQV